jgi:diguanylate cyclase (GGDEF)-like protein
VRFIVKNLNVLRSTISSISTSFEVKEIVEAAVTNLPNLFKFVSFGVFWKEGQTIYLFEEESCPASFTQEVVQNTIKVCSLFTEEPIDPQQVSVRVEKRKMSSAPVRVPPQATLKSHFTLPLAVEGEIIGGISLNSDKPNAFEAPDLQFFSVIGYQMAATLKHFQRFSSVKDMATYDTLTSLHNRRYFDERLTLETQKAFRSGAPLSLIMVDIDHFKKVNDTFGHTEGDKVLREISYLLRTSVRKKDVVARYGGEEFVLILPEAGTEESLAIAERIRRTVEKKPFEVGAIQLKLTVSLGISRFPDDRPASKEELIRMADLALYDAKRGGRNQVCNFQGEQKAREAKA